MDSAVGSDNSVTSPALPSTRTSGHGKAGPVELAQIDAFAAGPVRVCSIDLCEGNDAPHIRLLDSR